MDEVNRPVKTPGTLPAVFLLPACFGFTPCPASPGWHVHSFLEEGFQIVVLPYCARDKSHTSTANTNWTHTFPSCLLLHLAPFPDFSQFSSCLLGFFFCCSSVSKNVIENKLTGQTAPRFPLTRALRNYVFSSQQRKAPDVRKELDYKDFILQFYIWLKMSPNSCIMRRPFGSPASSLLAHNARFWRYRYRCGDDEPLGKNSSSAFLASALSIEKIIFLLHVFTQCTGSFTLASWAGRRRERSRNN